MHPIAELQGALVAALKADAALDAIVDGAVFDAAPIGRPPPYVVVLRHDLRQRAADLAPGQQHRVQLACWGDQPSRRRALDIAERVVAVALAFAASGITVTHREHLRTDTVVDDATGKARATVTLRFFTEG